jgi:hypothetical protein
MNEKPDRIEDCDHNEVVWETMVHQGVLLADGFENALIGYVERFGSPPVALYDREKCTQILMERDGMDYLGAVEFFEYNTIGAWVGETTPAFATLFETTDTQDRHNDRMDIHREQRGQSCLASKEDETGG